MVEIIQELVVVDHVECFRQVHLEQDCPVWRFEFIKPFFYITSGLQTVECSESALIVGDFQVFL